MPGGRPRKSIAQHQLEGTYRPIRHSRRGEPVAAGKPKRPRGLNANERWLWDLVVQDWMGEIDTAQLRQLCTTWHLLRESMKAAKKDPTDKDARLAVGCYASAFDRLAGKFGLNPGDRAKIEIRTENPDDTSDDRFFPRVVK